MTQNLANQTRLQSMLFQFCSDQHRGKPQSRDQLSHWHTVPQNNLKVAESFQSNVTCCFEALGSN